MYNIVRNNHYDFKGQSYDTMYPQLHRYPATMLPQIGIDVLKEFNIKGASLFDPYCGSGTSLTCGIVTGFKELYGWDINPLAVLMSKVKFSRLNIPQTIKQFEDLQKNFKLNQNLIPPKIVNIDFWFSKDVQYHLCSLKFYIDKICDIGIRSLFLLAFSDILNDVSYRHQNNVKLKKIKDWEDYKPDVMKIFYNRLDKIFKSYMKYYSMTKDIKIDIQCKPFKFTDILYDVCLTSPPYGDSHTTVSYGDFSVFSNEWLNIKQARSINKTLMGGRRERTDIPQLKSNTVNPILEQVKAIDKRRGKDVENFYIDLEKSIIDVAAATRQWIIYIVGNRTLLNGITTPTDQFVAEKFEENGFKHIVTYERCFPSKSFPSKIETTKNHRLTVTMASEYIVIMKK
jgi:hypothetical protein